MKHNSKMGLSIGLIFLLPLMFSIPILYVSGSDYTSTVNFSVGVGDSIIYKETVNGSFRQYSVRNITAITDNSIIMTINATRSFWNFTTSVWEPLLQNDPLETTIADTNRSIGRANDTINEHCEKNGPMNIVFKNGTTGQGINDTVGWVYIMWAKAFEFAQIGAWSVKFYNASNSWYYMYVEVFPTGHPLAGIVSNFTFPQLYMGNYYFMQWNYTPLNQANLNLTDNVGWGVKVGESLIYKSQYYGQTQINYGKYNVTAFSQTTGDFQDQLYPALGVNTTYFNYTGLTNSWQAVPDPMFSSLNPIIGIANEEAIFPVDGFTLVFPSWVTGKILNDTFGAMFAIWLYLDQIEYNNSNYKAKNSTDSFIEFSWNLKGIVTELKVNNISSPGGMFNISMQLMGEEFSIKNENGTVEISSPANLSQIPFTYIVDFGDNSAPVSGILSIVSHNYTINGTFTIKVTLILNTEFNNSHSENVVIVIKLPATTPILGDPPKDEDPGGDGGDLLPGYPLELLIGIMGISLILIKKRREKALQ